MNLLDSVEQLKGVGPKTAEILEKSGIRTVKDFFYTLPRAYDNYQVVMKINDLRPGKVVIRGKVDSLSTRRGRRRNMTITEGVIRDETGVVRVVWFNQGYRTKQLDSGKEYYFTGTYDLQAGRYQLLSPSVTEAGEVQRGDKFRPVYVAHGKLKTGDFMRLMGKARGLFGEVPDLIPGVKAGRRREALFAVHFPENDRQAQWGREYLEYEELFEFFLAAELNKEDNLKLKARKCSFSAERTKKFVDGLPFKLTDAQRKASWQIFQDLEKSTPMNRLLQGDVGSGKTMVAAMAAYEVAINGGQVAILAPTAILATQHFEKLKKLLEPFRIAVALLDGATKQKKDLKQALAEGKIQVLVGTHAILTDDTKFANLNLVIIDEQHRFGVEQRQKLMLKSAAGMAPHLLTMTATPIPRSLQLTIFGDLDVSVLDELPKGRQVVSTKIVSEINQKEQLYPEMNIEMGAGRQIYWICKAIEDVPRSEATSVKTRAEKLKKLFPKVKVEFLHGKMKPAEKETIMERFSRGEINILVSTTVVEVGVDVPNATLIVIENAENYGLAQLHQLRGRVGRGTAKSSCFLLIQGEKTPSRRLLELQKSNDGFYLSEVDLKLRGPGEIYGALQHGALNLKIASLADTKKIALVQSEVKKFLQSGENMLKYEELMTEVKKYQQLTTLN